MKKRKPAGTILICNLFLAVTIAFFQPLEYMLMNMKEFLIPFGNVWWVQLLLAIGITLVLSLGMLVLPQKAGRIAASFSLGLGIAFLAQALLFNNDRPLAMNTNWPIEVLNIFVWFGIVAITVSMSVYFSGQQDRRVEIVMIAIAWCLIVFQAVNFTIIATSVDASTVPARNTDHYLSRDGEFTLSKENNIVVFVLDSADDFYFSRMLKKFPETKEKLAGWIHYTNTTSEYSKTYPSITYLLTGEKCFYDQKPETYINQAFENSSFMKGIHDQETDIRVFTMEPDMVGDNSNEYISNRTDYLIDQKTQLQQNNTIGNMINVSLMRCLPYRMKLLIKNDDASIYNGDDLKWPFLDYTDQYFNTALNLSGMSVSDQYDNAFRFYHLWGVRPGYSWNEELADATDVPPENALMGSFKMIDSYISKMKEKGIYDKATIIVMGDHGFSGGGTENLTVLAAACPMLLVKYPNADDSQPLVTNEAPVAQEDLFATIETALGADVSGCGSGKTLNDIGEQDEREREYYYTAFYTEEDGEVALRKYIIDGPADILSNWHLTNEWWDIQYSMNKVSENRFSDK